METKLSIINNDITEVEKNVIDEQIEQFISKHKNNRYEINKLVFESVSLLTSNENYSNELENQGIFKKILGTVSGKNKKIQGEINNNLAQSQYASQQVLQKLAEQNLMSFELITAVNNKLNSSVIAIETEINTIYKTLITFFKNSKSNLIQLENRIERLERNINLLNWQNSIEYQMFDGIEYADLDDISKIVCLVRDFYDITKAKWTTSDLLLLKAAMSTIELSPKGYICYKDFLEKLTTDTKLSDKLFEGFSLQGMEKYPEYIAISAGFQKNELLKTSEKYIVDSNIQILQKHGYEISFEEARYEILESYQKSKGKFDLSSQINIYDFILEILYNLEQMKEINNVEKLDSKLPPGAEELDSKLQEEEILDSKLQEAEMLFSIYDVDKLIPLLEELIGYGYTKAKYMMSLLYETGCNGLKRDFNMCDSLLQECINEGYIPALIRMVNPYNRNFRYENRQQILDIREQLFELANDGDSFAAEEYSRCITDFYWFRNGDNDYKIAIEMLNKAPAVLGYFGIAKRYDNGQGVEKDYKKSFEYYIKSAKYGYSAAEYEVGRCYANGWGCDIDKQKAFEYYKRSEEHGNIKAINEIGRCYSAGWGIEQNDEIAFSYFLKGAEQGDTTAMSNVGWSYEYGNGVKCDYQKAIEWYKKANDVYSKRHLGFIYLNGKGEIPINRELARDYFFEAANAIYPDKEASEALKKYFNTTAEEESKRRQDEIERNYERAMKRMRKIIGK